MSGGFFDYKQDCIKDIAESIEGLVHHSGKTRNELHEAGIEEIGGWYTRDVDWWNPEETLARMSYWRDCGSPDEIKKWIEDHNREIVIDFSPETLREFRKAATLLRKAAIYAHRIDWLLSGDDGEDNFQTRLKEELDALKKKRR